MVKKGSTHYKHRSRRMRNDLLFLFFCTCACSHVFLVKKGHHTTCSARHRLSRLLLINNESRDVLIDLS